MAMYKMTMQRAYQDWLRTIKISHSQDTLEQYRQVVGFYLRSGVANPLDWINSLEGRQNNTIRTYIAILRSFHNYLVKIGLRRFNILADIELPPRVLPPVEPLSLAELKTLLDLCPEDTWTGRRDKAIILFDLDSGLRRIEMCSLATADVQPDGHFKVFGKGRKWRWGWVGPQTIKALNSYLEVRKDSNPSLWVTRAGHSLGRDGYSDIFVRLEQWSGIKCNPHRFRHTFACMMRETDGVDIHDLSQWMGHATIGQTEAYVSKQLSQRVSKLKRVQYSPVDTLLG